MHDLPKIDRIDFAAYRIPTDAPESDGTATWDHTDVVIVHIHAANSVGLGWSYTTTAAARIISDLLVPLIVGSNCTASEDCWQKMIRAVRNIGWPGVAATAISAVDIALWDLKAKVLQLPLVDLFGSMRNAIEIYGSGGFTSYNDQQLQSQFSAWRDLGIRRMKMKVGRNAADDPHRVALARRTIGDDAELFVDANGAYEVKQAIALANRFAEESNVIWFEEPRSSDDLEGLQRVKLAAPPAMEIAAGEYTYTPDYFRKMLSANAVDVIQADATRCGGYTGFLKAAVLAEAFHTPLSGHCAPQIHAHICCCTAPARHIEYFHDHVRIESLLFDGVLKPVNGQLIPDRDRIGHGLTLNTACAASYAV